MLALHDGRKQAHVEGQSPVVLLQLAAEVAIACRRGTGHYGNALHQCGKGQGLVVIYDAIPLQLAQYFLAAACHIAKGVGSVYVQDIEGVAIEFAEGDTHLHEHLQPGAEALPRLLAEAQGQYIICTRPYRYACACNDTARGLALLHQFAIEVPPIAFAPFHQFALNPIGGLHAPFYEGTHTGIEFEQGKCFHTSCIAQKGIQSTNIRLFMSTCKSFGKDVTDKNG